MSKQDFEHGWNTAIFCGAAHFRKLCTCAQIEGVQECPACYRANDLLRMDDGDDMEKSWLHWQENLALKQHDKLADERYMTRVETDLQRQIDDLVRVQKEQQAKLDHLLRYTPEESGPPEAEEQTTPPYQHLTITILGKEACSYACPMCAYERGIKKGISSVDTVGYWKEATRQADERWLSKSLTVKLEHSCNHSTFVHGEDDCPECELQQYTNIIHNIMKNKNSSTT